MNDATAATDTEPADLIVEELLATTAAKESNPTASSAPADISVPAPQAGLYFTVQVAATNRSPKRDNAWFESRFHFNRQVSRTEHEGWNKYLIGQFSSYEEAVPFGIRRVVKSRMPLWWLTMKTGTAFP